MTASLEDLQAFCARAIRLPVRVAEQPFGLAETQRMIAGNDRLSPTDQLEIYREQYWLRHLDALEEDYVTVLRLVGRDGFRKLTERYLEAYPPASFSLRDLGAQFAGFVSQEAPYCHDALLADCARLEWAFVEAFDAPDATPIGPEIIAAVPEDGWPAARLTLHPALQRVALGHRAHDYRAAVRRGDDPARPRPEPVRVAVYRGPDALQYVEIEALAFDLLERLSLGEALGDACEAVADAATGAGGAVDLEGKIGGWFQFWAAAGWLTGISCR